ncbi:MAG: hypothetical protein HY363_01145 [Candidatus Aenigmarchaeota archaeon]|nr:hypothetical protein [Candidatus Aenigmarchaeota archaeon]
MRLRCLEAIVLSVFAGCVTPQVQPAPTTAENQHEFLELARHAREENIERGGVIVLQGNRQIFIEIENTIRKDNGLFQQYVDFNRPQDYLTLCEHIDAALSTRTRCEPKLRSYFTAEAAYIKMRLNGLQYISGEERLQLAAQLWRKYEHLVLHNMYKMNQEQYSAAERQGHITAVVHTHDNTGPSLQDEYLSTTIPQIVVRINPDDSLIIYSGICGKFGIMPKCINMAN